MFGNDVSGHLLVSLELNDLCNFLIRYLNRIYIFVLESGQFSTNNTPFILNFFIDHDRKTTILIRIKLKKLILIYRTSRAI